jgi:hypothetical protein
VETAKAMTASPNDSNLLVLMKLSSLEFDACFLRRATPA